jgi:hypothetical protein
VQTGSWGALAQRAGAFPAEAGWQPAFLTRVRPWVRGAATGSGAVTRGIYPAGNGARFGYVELSLRF